MSKPRSYTHSAPPSARPESTYVGTVALAAALREQRVTFAENKDQHAQWCRDVQAITDVCTQFNANFDEDRFLAACGLTDGAK